MRTGWCLRRREAVPAPAGRAVGTATAGGAVAGAVGAAASTVAAAGGAEAAAAAGKRWDCWDCRALEAGPNRAAAEKKISINHAFFCNVRALQSLCSLHINCIAAVKQQNVGTCRGRKKNCSSPGLPPGCSAASSIAG